MINFVSFLPLSNQFFWPRVIGGKVLALFRGAGGACGRTLGVRECFYNGNVSGKLLLVARHLLQHVALYCSMLHYIAVCCSMLQYAAVCCSMLQCVAVCCSVLYGVAVLQNLFSNILIMANFYWWQIVGLFLWQLRARRGPWWGRARKKLWAPIGASKYKTFM